MDQDENVLSPTALVWDYNEELWSEDLDRVLLHLQTIEGSSQD